LKKRLRSILSEFLSPEELTSIYNSYDIIGDIAVIRVTEKSEKYSQVVAKTIMNVHKNVATVLAQTGPVHGGFRLRKLEFVAGEDRTTTVHKESSCLFSVDVKKCYFSPRLLYERMRVAEKVGKGEVVVNMFAGVGSFSIIIGKHSEAERVYSIDINPAAVQFMEENVRLNRLYGKVIPIRGDAKGVIEKTLRHTADRVLMPLPEKSFRYLPEAFSALKKSGGRIHYYDSVHAGKKGDSVEKVKLKVAEKLESLGVAFNFSFGRVVRTTGPNWYQTVLDIEASLDEGEESREELKERIPS